MQRGPQFPLVNAEHFQHEEPSLGGLRHLSRHGDYEVEHDFHHDGDRAGTGYGIVRVWAAGKTGPAWDKKGGRQVVASLKYDLDSMERATSLRPQPLTHTEYIDVDHGHQGKGLTHVMQSMLQRAHPGAPNIASNELTGHGARWREHLVKTMRDPGMGQRIGYHVPWDAHEGGWDEEKASMRVFRPAEGQPQHALVRSSGEFGVDDDEHGEFGVNTVAKRKKP